MSGPFQDSPAIHFFKAQGFSMEPFVLAGDELIVKMPKDGKFTVGDILLYRSELYSQPVAHRLVGTVNRNQFRVRSDANVLFEEEVERATILGRVEWVRRGNKTLRMSGTWRVRSFNWIVAKFYPLQKKIIHAIVPLLKPLIFSFQGTSLYKKIAATYFVPDISVSSEDGRTWQFVATVQNLLAGSACLEIKEKQGVQIGWVSTLSVRLRYRGAGIACRLVQKIEVASREKGCSELWLSYERENQIAAKLYKKLEFERNNDAPAYWKEAGCWDGTGILVSKRLQQGPHHFDGQEDALKGQLKRS